LLQAFGWLWYLGEAAFGGVTFKFFCGNLRRVNLFLKLWTRTVDPFQFSWLNHLNHVGHRLKGFRTLAWAWRYNSEVVLYSEANVYQSIIAFLLGMNLYFWIATSYLLVGA
jgi:hypothetical protein